MILLSQFVCEDDGVTAVEYAVMLGLIVAAVFGGIGSFGRHAGGLFSGIIDKLSGSGLNQ